MTQFDQALAANPQAQQYIAVELEGISRTTSAVVNVYLTSAPSLVTPAAADPDNAFFDSAIIDWTHAARIADPGTYFEGGGVTSWRFTVAADRVSADLDDVDCTGRTARIWYGTDRRRDGSEFQVLDWTQRTALGRPSVKTQAKDSERQWSFEVDFRPVNQPTETELWRGFAGSLTVPASSLILAPYDASLETGTAFTLVLTIYQLNLSTANFNLLTFLDGDATVVYGLVFVGPNRLRFQARTSTVTTPAGISPPAVRAAVPNTFIVTVDGANVKIYCGRTGADAREVVSGTIVPVTPSNIPGSFRLAWGSTTPTDLWQAAIIKRAMTPAEVLAAYDLPIPSTTTSLSHLWRFNDQTGLIAFAAVGAPDLPLPATSTWGDTLTGYDPETDPTDAVGLVMQYAWGDTRTVPMTRGSVDTYVMDSQPWESIDQVRNNGAILAAGVNYTANPLEASVTILGAIPDGTLTAEVDGRPLGAGESSATLAYGLLTGTTPNTDDRDPTFNPNLTIFSPNGSPLTYDQVRAIGATSVCGWYGWGNSGEIRIGTWLLPGPSDTPLLRLKGGGRRGNIAQIEQPRIEPPAWRLVCRYDPAGTTLDPGVLPGDISAAAVERLTQKWFSVERRDYSILERHPNAAERVVETGLNRKFDAERWLNFAEPLFMTERRWIWVTTNIRADWETIPSAAASVYLWATVEIEHEDPLYGLTTPLKTRIVAYELSPRDGVLRLLLWG